MKLYTLYENLIKETSVEACVTQFGSELFADQLIGNEPNTRKEDNYIELIKRFTDNEYGEETNPDFMKAMTNLKGCMNTYPEILIPEKTNIYRGLTIGMDYFIINKIIIDTKNPIPYSYKARSKVQSWSTSYDSASLFGNNEILNEIAAPLDFNIFNVPEMRQRLLKFLLKENVRMAFVLEYNTNKSEFLFKSKYFRKLSEAPHEDEVIRFGNKLINTKIKFNDSEDVFLSMKGLKLINVVNIAIKES